MALLTNLTILLVLACFSSQLLLSSCQKSQGRKGRGGDRGQGRDRPGLKVGRQAKSVTAQPVKGKMLSKDKAECSWEARGDELFTLSLTCRKGGRSFSCDYVARPGLCPQYPSNEKLYWKQVARSLRKQRNLCQDRGAQVKAGMCRGAPGEAHFRLQEPKKTTAPPSKPQTEQKPVKSCQGSNRKLAQEFCSDSWSSVCTFLFTMVQDYDC